LTFGKYLVNPTNQIFDGLQAIKYLISRVPSIKYLIVPKSVYG
jgi:hypothetical protein